VSKPHVISSQIIRNLDPHQTQLINRTRKGQMILAGQTLYVLEVQPAAYASSGERGRKASTNILEFRLSAAHALPKAERNGIFSRIRRWRQLKVCMGGENPTSGRKE